MADHSLDIGIVADTSKARNELALLEAQMRKTNKEIKSLSDVAVKTGDPKAVAGVKTLTASLDGMGKQAARFKKEIGDAHKQLNNFHQGGHAHKFYLVEQSLQSLNGALMAIGHNVGGAKAAIAGFAVGIGFTKLNEMLNEFSKNLGELRSAAGDIGIKPIQLQGAQRAVGAIGDEAEIATKALQGMNAQFEELRKNPPQHPTDTFSGGVTIFRGGQSGPTDFSKPLQMLGIEGSISRILPSRTANLEKQLQTLQAFVAEARRFDPTALNIISKTLFGGVPANSMLEAAPALLRQWQAEIEKLKTSSAGATDQALKEDKELIASKNAVANSYKEAAATVATALRPLQLWFNEVLGKALVRDANQFKKDFENISRVVQAGKDVKTFATPDVMSEPFGGGIMDPEKPVPEVKDQFSTLKGFFKGLTKDIGTTWDDFWKRFSTNAENAKDAFPQIFSGTVTRPTVGAGGTAQQQPLPEPEGQDVGRGRRLLYGGHGPYGHEVQSDTPGVSDYQASADIALARETAQAANDSAKAAQAADHATMLVVDATKSAADAAESSKGAAEAARAAADAARPLAMAEGGMISGPGTGTSDSIPARLSNGEFVMSAAAVSHWGPGLMTALNGLASPSFSGGGVPRFAEGGLVAAGAGGGTPVHLHLDGNSYAMRAESGVAQALVVASRRYQMRSAGVKPSWYGGRPGG